jgi:single-stranded DNA-binding protein
MSGEQDPRGQARGGEQGEKLPKVTIHGRIGQVYDVEYLTQKDMLPVFKFSLAEHPTADETIWYKVTTFGERADAMVKRFEDGELRVGQAVVVVGRLKVADYISRRTGQPGVDRQIYPFSVKPEDARPQDSPPPPPAPPAPPEGFPF